MLWLNECTHTDKCIRYVSRSHEGGGIYSGKFILMADAGWGIETMLLRGIADTVLLVSAFDQLSSAN